ncbi:hypothetical protein FJ364_01560 [Candidatus Dependentiae bacterium]|nr:hypothetical protein [Candidatus Dependentiae bacterium]
MLKKRVGNLSRLSNGYTKQSRFEGSRRQIRGKILELMLKKTSYTQVELESLIADTKNRTQGVIEELLKENFLIHENNLLVLKK